jgi:hypothetical protein
MEAIRENEQFAWLLFAINAALCAIAVAIVYAKRRRVSRLLVLLIAAHPGWWNGTGGDCGRLTVLLSQVALGASVLICAAFVVHSIRHAIGQVAR